MTLTKSEEIESYRQFLAGLPRNGYLADILAGTDKEVEALIRSDLGWPLSVAQNIEARRYADEELAKVVAKADQARAQLRDTQAELLRCQKWAAECLDNANAIADRARRVVNKPVAVQ